MKTLCRHSLLCSALTAAGMSSCDSRRTAEPRRTTLPHPIAQAPDASASIPQTTATSAVPTEESSLSQKVQTASPSTRPLVKASILARLKPKERRLLGQMREFCTGSVRADPQGRWRVGCRACLPDGETRAGGPPLLLDYAESPFSEVTEVVEGSFSEAGADEVAVVSSGCDEAAQADGGVYVLKKDGGRYLEGSGDGPWRAKRFVSRSASKRRQGSAPVSIFRTRRCLSLCAGDL